ncbi:MAG: serine hydrolase domain-containing protein [Myxococcota bacterium]
MSSFGCWLFACVLSVPTAHAEPPAELRVGEPLEAALAPSGVDRYALVLGPAQHVALRVFQRGVDVAVTVRGPGGEVVREVDSPNGRSGPEWVVFDAGVAGAYPVEVRAIEPDAPAGGYEIRLVAVGARPTTPAERMDADLAVFNVPDAPGVAVSVTRDGAVVYRGAFGMADLAHDAPITTSSVFHVASLSKQFTAFAVLLLEADGRLSLEDDVHRYLPELAVDAPITLRNLAQHTSGVRDIDELLRMAGGREQDAVTHRDAVELLCRQTELNFTPGSTFEYSNSGFILLAEVVERVSGMPFAAFAAERIFAPLGMTRTRFVDDAGTVVHDKAISYGATGAAYVERPLNHALVGSTGLNTTVEDLDRWARNFEDGAVGGRALFDAMERPGTLTGGEPITYGLGLDHKTYRGEALVFHGGGDAGYRAYIVRVPARRFTVAITSNAEEFNPVEAANRAIDHFLFDDAPAEVPPPFRLRKSKRGPSWAGDYELFPGQIFTIARTDDGYTLRGSNDTGPPTPMRPVSATEFELGDPFHRISFPPATPGSPQPIRYHVLDFVWSGRRVTLTPPDPGSVHPEQLVGRYYSAEVGVDYTVTATGGGLALRGPRGPEVAMRPFGPDAFVTDQGHLSEITFARDVEGRVTGCAISGSRARGVAFERVADR